MTTCSVCGAPFPPRAQRRYCSARCKSKENHARAYRKHREKRLVEAAAYREANRDRIRKWFHTYDAKRKDHQAAKSRAWHAANKKRANTGRMQRMSKTLDRYPWTYLLGGAKSRASKKGMKFNLTNEWASERWTGRCELTNLPFDLTRTKTSKSFSPSIDKIDPRLGYTVGNCRFILWAVNAFKYADDDATMFFIAEALLKNRGKA